MYNGTSKIDRFAEAVGLIAPTTTAIRALIEEYLFSERDRSYSEGAYGEGSYRRRRDSMGRYARNNSSSYESGYAEAADDMNSKLEDLMREARTEDEHRAIRGVIEHLG